MSAGKISRGALYMTLNVVSAVSLVLLNKTILSTLHFHFTLCLTLLHTIATMTGDLMTSGVAHGIALGHIVAHASSIM